jgi:hypothetical protein
LFAARRPHKKGREVFPLSLKKKDGADKRRGLDWVAPLSGLPSFPYLPHLFQEPKFSYINNGLCTKEPGASLPRSLYLFKKRAIHGLQAVARIFTMEMWVA